MADGSLVVTRFEDHIELQLSGLGLEKPRMYAYEAHEQVGTFLQQVAIDTGSKYAELASSQGAAVSPTMAHSFAWRPGRTLTIDGKQVKVDTEASASAASAALPGAARRPSTVKSEMKYVVITGGVVSGLGKGVTASSLGVLMRCAGFRVTSIKIDPYLNVDAGTMSPFEHGEVFTLDDGGEVSPRIDHAPCVPHSPVGDARERHRAPRPASPTRCAMATRESASPGWRPHPPRLFFDQPRSPVTVFACYPVRLYVQADLDLGNYERFCDITLGRDNNITTGKIYQQCLERERKGDYLGKTVQVVPHVTDAIMDWIQRVAHVPGDGQLGPPDVCIIELGGTVGDIESMPYVEALRQFQFRVGVSSASHHPHRTPRRLHSGRLIALSSWPTPDPHCELTHTRTPHPHPSPAPLTRTPHPHPSPAPPPAPPPVPLPSHPEAGGSSVTSAAPVAAR